MWRTFKWLLVLILVGVIGYAGYYGYSIYKSINEITKPITGINGKNTYPRLQPPKWNGGRVNILLLGGDSRGLKNFEVPRSDSILVLSLDPDTKQASLYSILRDTWVKIPGHGEDRINAALSVGGPELSMKTVSDLLNIPINYYVFTDFQGFIGLINAIGGIDYTVEKDMHYHDSEEPMFNIDLKKGYQHLNGKTALEYVRFRHDAMSDFARTDRQREFLGAVAKKVTSTTSLLKLPQILNSIDPYIKTDMYIQDMWKLASLGYEVKGTTPITAQLPPTNLLKETTIRGQDVLTVDPKTLQSYFMSELYNKTISASSGSSSASPSPSK